MKDNNDENKFEASKKEILTNLKQVEASVSNNIKALNRTLIQTKYYKEFRIKSLNGKTILRNFFITVEKQKNGKLSYHFRWLEKKLAMIEENVIIRDDKLYTRPEIKEMFENIDTDIQRLMELNDNSYGALKGISTILNSEQLKMLLNGNEELLEDCEYVHKIESDMVKQGDDVKIGKHMHIKSSIVNELSPEVFEKGKKYELIEDKISRNYLIIEKNDGKYRRVEDIEPGNISLKRIYATSDDEMEEKEFEILEQTMDVEGYSTKKITIQRDEAFELNIQVVRTLPCHNIDDV